MKTLYFKFISVERYHLFVDMCHRNGITVWVTKEDRNLNKKFKVFRRHVVIDDFQECLFSDFIYAIQ